MDKYKIIIILVISLCIRGLIGSFAASKVVKHNNEQHYNLRSEKSVELENTINEYLVEHGGCGEVDMSELFEETEVTPTFGGCGEVDMSELFEKTEVVPASNKVTDEN